MSSLYAAQQQSSAGHANYGESLLIQCEPVKMELTYITERIIALSYSDNGDESAYIDSIIEVADMLKNKHGERFKVINLSESRRELLTSCNGVGQVLECGWPPQLAPPLERLCTICRDIDEWLHGGSGSQRTVIVLHCRGGLDRMAVVLAAYINYSSVVAKLQQPLDRLAMKQFFDEQLARILEPSQIRYIRYFSGLLTGSLRVSTAPVYLQHIVIHGVPQFGPTEVGDYRGGLQPFVRVYQGMQPVYTSNVYSVQATQPRVCISMRQPLELFGDILVKCYHKRSRGRESVFRLQFNTSTVVGDRLLASKMELDDAIEDQRFSDRSRVELIFVSPGAAGQQHQDVSLSWESSDDPIVKWDSYEHLIPAAEVQTQVKTRSVASDRNLVRVSKYFEEGPLEDSMFAKMQKRMQVNDGEIFADSVFRGNGNHPASKESGGLTSGISLSTSSASSWSAAGRTSATSSGQSTGVPSAYSATSTDVISRQQSQRGSESVGAGVTGLVRGVQASPTASPSLLATRQQEQQAYKAEIQTSNGPYVPLTVSSSVGNVGTTSAATQWSIESKEQQELDEILNELLGDSYTPSPVPVTQSRDPVLPPSPYSTSSPSVQVSSGSAVAAGSYHYGRSVQGAAAGSWSPGGQLEDKSSSGTARNSSSVSSMHSVEGVLTSGVSSGSTSRATGGQQQQIPQAVPSARAAAQRSSPRSSAAATWAEEQPQVALGMLDAPSSPAQLSPAAQLQAAAASATLEGAGVSWLEQQQRKLLARNKSRSEDESVRKQQQERQLVSELRLAQERKRNQSQGSESQGGVSLDEGRAYDPSPPAPSAAAPWLQTDTVVAAVKKQPAASPAQSTLSEQTMQQRMQQIHIQANNLNDGALYTLPSEQNFQVQRTISDQQRRIQELEEMVRLMDQRQRMQDQQLSTSAAPVPPVVAAASVTGALPGVQAAAYGGNTAASASARLGAEAKPPRPPKADREQDEDELSFRTVGIQNLESTTLPRLGGTMPTSSTVVPAEEDGARQQSPYFRSVSRSVSQDGGFGAARRDVTTSGGYQTQQRATQQIGSVPSSPGMNAMMTVSSGSYTDSLGTQLTGDFRNASPFQQQYGQQNIETVYSRQQAVHADISSPYFNNGGTPLPGTPMRNLPSNGSGIGAGLQQPKEGIQFQGSLSRNGHWNGSVVNSQGADGNLASVGTASLQQMSPSPPAETSYGASWQQQTLRFGGTAGQAQTSYTGTAQNSPDSLTDGNAGLSDTGYVTSKFVRDTSKFWYKPSISRDEAINMLKDAPPGTFVVRDSNSFPGAFGLALKVAHLPPGIAAKSSVGSGGDLSSEFVRFFLIEPTAKGVRLKGCSNEPAFGSLAALIYQHTVTQLALPCKLILPDPAKMRLAADVPITDVVDASATESAPAPETPLPSSAADLLSRGASCCVVYLNSVDTESLTGPQAVSRAVQQTFANNRANFTVVNFKVSTEGITVTDTNRKLFFRQHFPRDSISFCGLDPADRRFTQVLDSGITLKDVKIFGFVAKRNGNQCLLFAEMDPDQPASAIVNFITKVMMPAK